MPIIRFTHWKSSIQTKITLFIVVVVVSVLFVSMSASRTMVEQRARELLKEEYINIVEQIEAGIGTVEELRDTALLEEELARLREVKPNLLMVEIFTLTPEGVTLTARSGSDIGHSSAPPHPSEIEAMRRGEVISRMEKEGPDLLWNILVPVRLRKKEPSGLIHAHISTREFDALVTWERRQAFFFTQAAALVILLFLTWYLRRTIGRPIERLVQAMREAEAGDLNRQIPIESLDEIGALSGQFNRMLMKIREGTEQTRRFNETLQEKVEQATAEVNRRYEELAGVNRRLSEARLQLAHFERLAAAGEMAAVLAHKIGTPLHSILGHLQRLKRDTSDQKKEERLKIIESQVEQVAQIIQEALERVRKPTPRMEPVDMNSLLRDLLELVGPGISLRGIDVETVFEERLPPIMGESDAIGEVFLNLLTNAMDAMPGGGALRLETRSDAPDKISPLSERLRRSTNRVIVTIADTGSGIAEADLPKIFEPFFTTKERGKGTGLGLSITQSVIKAHGGEIQVSSRLGLGTVFTVILQVKHDEAE